MRLPLLPCWREVLREREQLIGHFGDEFTHGELTKRANQRNCRSSMKRASQLSIYGCSGIGIVAKVGSDQPTFSTRLSDRTPRAQLPNFELHT